MTKKDKKVVPMKDDPYKFIDVHPQPAFPSDISINDVKIVLNADGSWEGDANAFIEAVETMLVNDYDGVLVVTVWSIVNILKVRMKEMKDEQPS